MRKIVDNCNVFGIGRGGSGSSGTVSVEIGENGNWFINGVDTGVCAKGKNGITFTPHISDDFILSWTNDGGLENPPDCDLNPYDEWSSIEGDGDSPYIWVPME